MNLKSLILNIQVDERLSQTDLQQVQMHLKDKYTHKHIHREVAKYNDSQEEFKKLQVHLRNPRSFEFVKQLGGSDLLPDHLPPPQPVLLDMRLAGAEGLEEKDSKASKVCSHK